MFGATLLELSVEGDATAARVCATVRHADSLGATPLSSLCIVLLLSHLIVMWFCDVISYGDRSDKLGRGYMAMFHMPFCNPD